MPACRAYSIAATRCHTAHQHRQRERGERGNGRGEGASLTCCNCRDLTFCITYAAHCGGQQWQFCAALCFALLLSDSVPLLPLLPSLSSLSLSRCLSHSQMKTITKQKQKQNTFSNFSRSLYDFCILFIIYFLFFFLSLSFRFSSLLFYHRGITRDARRCDDDA